MKKQIFIMVAAIGLLTACDPSKDSVGMPGNSSLSGDQLASGFTTKQFSDETYTSEAADGNYFQFFTSPSRVVTIYQLDEEGNRNVLASGKANGTFKIVPKRGNPSTQTYYIETRDFNGNTITGTKTANVYVPQELEPYMRLLASDAYGSKTWKWDTEFREDGAVWGNTGYAAGDDWTSGIWWGSTPEGLTTQLNHSETGVATGEESSAATMVIYDDGNVACFDAGGNQIRKGKIQGVEGWTGEKIYPSAEGSVANWSYGTLITTEGAILWPFQINNHSADHDNTLYPTRFEILQLDANHMKLMYPQAGVGSWGEATWWAFKSNSDPEAALTDFNAKAWTWDTEFREDGAVWGNAGYAAGEDWTSGIWWGAKPEDLTGQLQHSDTGVATGEESADAYMTFDWKAGKVTSYDAAGTAIRSGNFVITTWDEDRSIPSAEGSQASWSYGTLTTDAGAILWPFQINSHNADHDNTTCPTTFEILQLDADHMKLMYPQEGVGSWGEATWWAFKKK